jgi:GcrA cell cycle regulator
MVAHMVETNGSGYRWFEDRVARLKQLWPDHSASQIAKLFGNLTRNAIIGKANRLKLQRKKQPVRSGRPLGWRRPMPAQVIPPPPELPPPIIKLEFLGLTIDELREGECHYPEGEHPPYRFCGQFVQAGSSYCPYHHGITNHQIAPRRDQYDDYAKWRGVR